jgi:hypothetical protein
MIILLEESCFGLCLSNVSKSTTLRKLDLFPSSGHLLCWVPQSLQWSLTIVVRYSVIVDSWKKYNEKYSCYITRLPSILTAKTKRSVFKIKCVSYKKKTNYKWRKKGREKVQFHMQSSDSKEPNRVRASIILHWDGNRSSFGKVVCLETLKSKHRILPSLINTPLPETFRIESYVRYQFTY